MAKNLNRREFGRAVRNTLTGMALLAAPVAFAGESRTSLGKLFSIDIKNLDGELVFDSEVLTDYANDYGNIVHKIPSVILRPGSVSDIIKVIKYANVHNIKVAVRGQGHCMYGQTQVENGIAIDMATMKNLQILSPDLVKVGGGSTWGPVMHESYKTKRTLPVVNDTFLSVGGSLSTGGFGPTGYNRGFMVDQVKELEVVTGSGELVTCSDAKNPDLFNAMLAGMGQCGIIVSATTKLVSAPTHVLFIKMEYETQAAAAHDLEILARDERFQHLDGRSLALPFGGLQYYIEGGYFYDEPAQPDLKQLIAGLNFKRQIPKVQTYEEYFRREETCYSCVPVPKPSLYMALPASKYDQYMDDALNSPESSSYISPRMSAWKSQYIQRPLVRIPQEEIVFRTQINRVLPNDANIPAFLAVNRSLYEKARDLGGIRLTTSAIPFQPEDWIRHYGPAWEKFEQAKHTYDPKNILGTSHNMFTF